MLHLTFIQILHRMLEEQQIDPVSWEIRSIELIDSTSTLTSSLLTYYPQVIVLSKVQSSGRGRKNDLWHSPEGGVWLSVGINRELSVSELSTPLIHTVQKILSRYVNCEVKLPNDILINGKKVCGLLVETKIQSNIIKETVVGVGVNVINEIPDEISTIATRLADHGDVPSVPHLASEIATEVVRTLQSFI